MQQSWQNMGMGGSGFASLQAPQSLTNTASGSNRANIPGINQVELPSWMGGSPDSSMGELLQTYSGIGAAFDPSGQVAARNEAIGYNTSAGGQAANNAATEYSNRASQSGASQLGAGVVKAQAMMPVFARNASLKTDAADVAAKSHREAAGLAAQISSTIGQLRQSYLSTLTGYATGQQGLALDRYKAEQASTSQAQQTQLGYASLQADMYKQAASAQQQRDGEARLAATTLLNQPRPFGMYSQDNQGNVNGGKDFYQQLQDWNSSRSRASQALNGMF